MPATPHSFGTAARCPTCLSGGIPACFGSSPGTDRRPPDGRSAPRPHAVGTRGGFGRTRSLRAALRPGLRPLGRGRSCWIAPRSGHRRHRKRSRRIVLRGCIGGGPSKGPLPCSHPCSQTPPPSPILGSPLLPRPLWAGSNGGLGIPASPAVLSRSGKPPNPHSTRQTRRGRVQGAFGAGPCLVAPSSRSAGGVASHPCSAGPLRGPGPADSSAWGPAPVGLGCRVALHSFQPCCTLVVPWWSHPPSASGPADRFGVCSVPWRIIR